MLLKAVAAPPPSECSIGALEPVLDAYALGEMPDAIKQPHLQAHFLTCEYCGRLLRVAEDIRAGLGHPVAA
ncbi:MAG TPA: hypothetical protein VFL57_07645 [Bryobacteraceae bacterium]|nr:hypothetical protein [Bryobacteraceae bacterium]